MSTPYLAKGYPFPMPVLTVRFRRLADSTASAPQVAIVDTGADMTIAPAVILTDLQAQELQETNLISQWGDAHPVILYIVDLEIDDQVLPGVLVAGDDTATEVILGRNVLNLLPLFLDGLHRQIHLLTDAQTRRLRK
jgi:predicted aspartyl protease